MTFSFFSFWERTGIPRCFVPIACAYKTRPKRIRRRLPPFSRKKKPLRGVKVGDPEIKRTRPRTKTPELSIFPASKTRRQKKRGGPELQDPHMKFLGSHRSFCHFACFCFPEKGGKHFSASPYCRLIYFTVSQEINKSLSVSPSPDWEKNSKSGRPRFSHTPPAEWMPCLNIFRNARLGEIWNRDWSAVCTRFGAHTKLLVRFFEAVTFWSLV